MADSIVEEPTNFFASSSSPLSSQEEHHQEEEQPQEQPSSPATTTSMIFFKIISKRRTWVCLFVCVYTVLLALSLDFLKSVLSWYELTMLSSSSSSSEGGRVSYYSGWAALYGSMLLGLAFGVLSTVAALAVAVPATLVTWISILVLLTFFGKPRRALVLEGKKITIDIIGFVLKVLIKEGNIVAALCAVLGYFAFVRKSKEDGRIPSPAAAHL